MQSSWSVREAQTSKPLLHLHQHLHQHLHHYYTCTRKSKNTSDTDFVTSISTTAATARLTTEKFSDTGIPIEMFLRRRTNSKTRLATLF